MQLHGCAHGFAAFDRFVEPAIPRHKLWNRSGSPDIDAGTFVTSHWMGDFS
jgi:hypothetical protein